MTTQLRQDYTRNAFRRNVSITLSNRACPRCRASISRHGTDPRRDVLIANGDRHARFHRPVFIAFNFSSRRALANIAVFEFQ